MFYFELLNWLILSADRIIQFLHDAQQIFVR